MFDFPVGKPAGTRTREYSKHRWIQRKHAGRHDSSTGVLKGSEDVLQERTRVPVAANAGRELRLEFLFMPTPARDRLVSLGPRADGKTNKFA